jgi:hypothetical protein
MMSLALSLGRCFPRDIDVACDPSARFDSTASHMVEGFTGLNPNFETLNATTRGKQHGYLKL